MLGFMRRLAGSRGRVQNNTITTSKDLAEVLVGDVSTKSGVRVTAKTAMGIAAVNAAVRLVSENTGMLPFPVYRRLEENGREIKIKDRTHPLWNVLNRQANVQMSAQEFRETMVSHMLLYRHGFAFINRVQGRVQELIPIHPNRVTVTENRDMSLAYAVNLSDGTVLNLDQTSVFHVMDFSPEGLNGKSRVFECREALGLTKAAENYGASFFANGGTPLGVLSTKENVKPDDIKKIRTSWNESGSGTKVVDNGFEFKAISTNASEAQMIETRKFQITEIARIFRIPPHKLGDLERATFSNIDAQEIDFQQNTMMPWYRRIELAVENQLMDADDRETHFVKIDNRAMLRGDQRARAEYYQRMRVSKIMTANECRDLEDMNPIEGGDVLENPTAPTDQLKDTSQDQPKE